MLPLTPARRRKMSRFLKVWAKIKKIQEDVRRRGLAENMLTDDDLYDENGLPSEARHCRGRRFGIRVHFQGRTGQHNPDRARHVF